MASAKRTAILHIGTAKTGSSAIQAALQALRDRLPGHGAHYPRSLGERNHTRLALYAVAGEGGDRSLERLEDRISGRAATIRRWLPGALAAELDALPAAVRTLVLSNEQCHTRLRTESGVRALKDLLDPFCDAYEVVVYLRRQDEMAVSRHTTVLRAGGDGEDALALRKEGAAAFYDLAGLLDRWGAVFGREALRPRVFARGELLGGDVVADFLAACGLAGVPPPERDSPQNPALSAAAQEFLRRFNGVYRRLAPGAPRPRELLNVLSDHHSGPGTLPARAAAQAFLARFAEGNERIRREFFPARASLFGTDFGRYPEVPEPVPEAAVAGVAAAAIGYLAGLPDRRLRKRPELAAALDAARRVAAGGA